MRLSAEVSSQDVQEALRLFKVSTMAAASAGSTAGDVGSLRPETQQEVRRAEDFLKRRIAVRSTVNRKKVPYGIVEHDMIAVVVAAVLNKKKKAARTPV